MTDTAKYKSVIVRVETHKKLKKLAGKDKKISGILSQLVDKEYEKNNVTYIDLISEKTVDENIVNSLRNKIDLASQSLGEKLKSWLIEGKKKKT